jgi:hypothetical protein
MTRFIKKSGDLETTYAAQRSGFLDIALRKNREALPYVDEAKVLKSIAITYKNPSDLSKDVRIFSQLVEAAGVSTKANDYLTKTDVEAIVKEFIKNFLETAGENFSDELVYRFLLTKGDALGGRMRNIVGAIASERLTRCLLASLRISRIAHEARLNDNSEWKSSSYLTQDDLISVKAIRWITNKGMSREIIYNIKVPMVGKSVDIVLLNKKTPSFNKPKLLKMFLRNSENYVALGELKGGIDPAGADEHWKTASTALQRIRTAFMGCSPDVKTFFVGAAIEASMAEEIFNQVKIGELSMAANLTNENQLAEICYWLIDI